MKREKALRPAGTENGVEILEYRPRLWRPYFTGWSGYAEDHTARSFSHRVRMAIELLETGYRVFYLKDGGELVGYVAVARGGGRLRCAGKNDIVIGPVFTPKRFRGKGYATVGETAVLHGLGLEYGAAYEYIKKENLPSLRVAEKCGFRPVGEGAIRGRLRRVYDAPAGTGTHVIVRYTPGDDPEKQE